MEIKQKKIAFISLGCDKNKVDLEEMIYNISSFGLEITDIDSANIVLINTCAFILSSRQESINNIIEMIELKKQGKIEKIIVTGCLCQRYIDELKKYLPEVDEFVPIQENKNIVQILGRLYGNEIKYNYENRQMITGSKHFAYLKIADGCNNACAYCTIPRIRGRYKSITIQDVVNRAKQLVDSGAKELIVVAQDVTRYGFDLYNEYKIVELLENLTKINNLKWIRLHYCYPELVSDELLEFIKNNEKMCKYLDIPLQHIDNKILKAMNRRTSEDDCLNLIKKIKLNYPEITIRSTFIIGFPGETRKQFNKLCRFLKEYKLDNVGFFAYSREESTKAFYMKKQIPEFIKKLRLKKIQKIQYDIAHEKNINKIGTKEKVVIDSYNAEKNCFIGRTKNMSPDIDFYVEIMFDNKINIGYIYNVRLIDFKDFCYIGQLDEN